MAKKTLEGLPLLTEEIIVSIIKGNTTEEFIRRIMQEIQQQNPLAYKALQSGIQNAPDKISVAGYQFGFCHAYELLRSQASKNIESFN